jgi:actin-like ATPase involved in cell morphogenesis
MFLKALANYMKLFQPFASASHDMAIDLGTVNTVVYVRDKGIVLNEACAASRWSATKPN